uniref:Uncharacterized protein n=1 Tax=Amphimedon queenslandica TaxID=400682 RepID=A0A1X7SJF4_AMPQE
MSRLLLLSGDVELNPGPTVEEACIKLQQILRSHYESLERSTRGSLSDILSKLYANNVITESVKDSDKSQSYSKMMQEFNAKLSLLKDITDLKRHCQVFLECISQGGPTDAAAKSLAIEWGKVFDMESLLPVASTVLSSTPSLSPISTSTSTSASDDHSTALSPASQLSSTSE